MSYKVLYRKYRPTSFDEIIGQQKIVNILKKSIELEKTAHAYIFTGMRGTGKTSMAHIFAKSINCLSPDHGIACGKCNNCLNINTSPDIIEIDAASNNSVDNIRELIENSRLVPTSLNYKIYIIDEVHMLSTGAFNALLKTLEEPSPHIKFILATTEIQKVPITILSRCQRFDFTKIEYDEITKLILNICLKENINIDKEAAEEISFLSDGSLRDALSILDQLANNVEKITLAILEENFGTLSNKSVKEFVDIINSGVLIEIHQKIEEFINCGIDCIILINKILHVYKELILNKIKTGENFGNYQKIIMALSEKLYTIKGSYDPYLMFELVIMENVQSITKKTEIKDENYAIDNEIKETKKNINEAEPFKEKISTSVFDNLNNIRLNNCFTNASKEMKDLSQKKWGEFTEYIRDKNLTIYSVIENCEVEASSEKIIVLSTENASTYNLLNIKMQEIEEIYNKTNNSDYKFCFIIKTDWQEKKKEYILNHKNNIKYEIIEEPIVENKKIDKISEQAKELFGEDNVDFR